MRVLLTGGAGYVGSALVGRLCQRPDLSEIVVYDNLGRGRGLFLQGPARPVAPVRLVQADLLDTLSHESVRSLVRRELLQHMSSCSTHRGPDGHGLPFVMVCESKQSVP
jgi:nucleoside-diphosphate-sugar epimerase